MSSPAKPTERDALDELLDAMHADYDRMHKQTLTPYEEYCQEYGPTLDDVLEEYEREVNALDPFGVGEVSS